jgi:threonine/homoserine/homoserine lactone efflux protein
MELSKLINIICINLLGLIMPGASMALLVKNSIVNGKKYGYITAIGLTVGDIFHILLIVLGLTSIITTDFLSLHNFKIIGAVYLIYLGFKNIRSKHMLVEPSQKAHKSNSENLRIFIEGLLTSVTNPSVLLFFTSMFIIIIEDGTTPYELFNWSLLIISMTITWLFMVVIFSALFIFQNNTKSIIQKIIGWLLILLGLNVYCSV